MMNCTSPIIHKCPWKEARLNIQEVGSGNALGTVVGEKE